MLKLIVSLLSLASTSAMATPLITCNNPATGAQITVSTDAQGNSYSMNSTLMSALDQQHGNEVSAQGTGGSYRGGDEYILQFSQSDFLSLEPYEGGPKYVLSVFRAGQGSENFVFNPGECK